MRILEKITEQIAALAPRREEAVIEALVERRLNQQKEAIVQGLDLLNRKEAELRRSKPDDVKYAEDGTIASSYYSKSALDARTKLTETITNLKKALNLALETGELDKLNKFVSNKGDTKSDEA